MKSWHLRLYHLLPPKGRSWAASVRGRTLRDWRYGPETDRLVAEALARESWDRERWAQWREERLAFILERAATKVPYYREHWAARRRNGDAAPWEQLANWPLLEKEDLRSSPAAFLADGCDPARMFHEHTSGTTGTPLDLWRSRQTTRAWYALAEARWRCWYGVDRTDRWAILGGQLVTPAAQQRPPFWVWNGTMKQLYMSSYHLAPHLVGHYVEALRAHRVRYILGYTSALVSLAHGVLASGGRLELAAVVTNAEPLLAWQRDVLERAFGAAVRETYGMAEAVVAAGECEAGGMHLWPEVGDLEVLRPDGEPVEDGETGEFVATGLLDPDMPLIRYRLGDRGARSPGHEGCACGRSLPRLAGIEGRCDDVLYTRDGRSIGRLDPVFKSRLPIREAQIIQESADRFRIRIVPVRGFAPEHARELQQRLRERVGSATVVIEEMDAIPRDANGKLRMVINRAAPVSGGRRVV